MQKVGVFLPRVTVGFRSYARTLVALRVVLISLSSNPVFSKIRSALFPFLCSQSRSPVLLAWRHGTAWDFVFHILSLTATFILLSFPPSSSSLSHLSSLPGCLPPLAFLPPQTTITRTKTPTSDFFSRPGWGQTAPAALSAEQ